MRILRAISLVAVLIPVPPAAAQGVARTFDQLAVLVQAGDEVRVTDAAGIEARGSLSRLSADSVEILTAQGPRTWGATDVQRVRHRYSDPVRNGVLIGAGVGAGFAAIAYALTCPECDAEDAGWIALGIGIYAGGGAGLGALVDVLHKGTRTVYERPAAAGGSFAIGPILDRTRRGLAAGLRF
jgi:hypothetical protein